jgi:ribosomal protein S18 acetylase RimI-like enzyme
VVQDQEVWVWVEDHRVLGFASLGANMLNHLYVDPAHQHRGIGDALLAHAKLCRPQGLRLWTFQANDRARHFYERRGFCVVEMTDGSRNEERSPDALYEWTPE